MNYYKVNEGCEFWHPNGTLLGKAGDVFPLATDSKDRDTKKAADGVLRGRLGLVTPCEKPGKKPKASKKPAKPDSGADYKTREMTSGGGASAEG